MENDELTPKLRGSPRKFEPKANVISKNFKIITLGSPETHKEVCIENPCPRKISREWSNFWSHDFPILRPMKTYPDSIKNSSSLSRRCCQDYACIPCWSVRLDEWSKKPHGSMKTDCCQHVRKHFKYQQHAHRIHVCASKLYNLITLQLFPVRGIYISRKIDSASSSGHTHILVAVDYSTKWMEVIFWSRTIILMKNDIINC